ncbi:proline racemase family protein [soil metagenome]
MRQPQQQPIIRNYPARDRRSAEIAYRSDAERAAGSAWFPVAHRWTEGWSGATLSVVFEYRGATASPLTADAPPVATAAVASRPPATAAQRHARSTMTAIDLHCAGEPLRLLRSGFPEVPIAPILERRRWVKENADLYRRVAMFEPRGHRDMYGAILMPPYRPDADVAVLFMHNEGFSSMCGHGIIALTTGLIEERLYPAAVPETIIRFETPAGLVTARARVQAASWGGPEVETVRFTNVPAYLAGRDIPLRPAALELPDGPGDAGVVKADLGFGGAYYGIVRAADLGLRVVPGEIDRLTHAGAIITELLRAGPRPVHPTDPELGFIYGTIIVDEVPASSPDGMAREADLRNVTIFADAEVDRSPCGSGTSALLAQRLARGLLAPGKDLVNASITGQTFTARVEGDTLLGAQEAVETSVEGRAFVTGHPTFTVDDRDPLGNGFLLR